MEVGIGYSFNLAVLSLHSRALSDSFTLYRRIFIDFISRRVRFLLTGRFGLSYLSLADRFEVMSRSY